MADPLGTAGLGEEEAPRPPKNRVRDVRLVLSGVALGLLVWFALANLQDVEIHFWVVSARSPLIIVVAIAGLLGGAVTLLVSKLRRRRRRDEPEG